MTRPLRDPGGITLTPAAMADLKKLEHGYEVPAGTNIIKSLMVVACPNPEGAEDQWRIVKPKDIPEFIHGEGTIERMIGGEMIYWEALELWLRAIDTDD